MTNLVSVTLNNSYKKKRMEQTLFLPIFDFMGFKLLYKYNNNHISMFMQLFAVTKEIIKSLLCIFIFVSCYYLCMRAYNFDYDNDQLTIISTANFDELKPINLPKIWYKSIIDDFFNQFTSKGKTFNHEFIKIQSSVKTLPLDYNLDTIEKSIILNRIKSDHMNSLIAECEFYKNKTSLLEIQLQWIKIIHHSLVNDLKDILYDFIPKNS